MAQVATKADVAHDWELWIGRTAIVDEEPVTTWTQIRGFEAMPHPDQQPERQDATHMQSPGRARETIAGLLPEAEWSQEKQLWPEDDGDILLKELSDLTRLGTAEDVLIEFNIGPDTSDFRETFRGEVSSYIATGTVGQIGMANLTLLIRDPQPTNPRVVS